jgi:hypothetical protein
MTVAGGNADRCAGAARVARSGHLPRRGSALPALRPARPIRPAFRRMRTLPCGPLLCGVLLAFLAGGTGTVQAAERPLRLGVFHPRPRLCLADEPSQRDLRVLRLAFGVARVPAERLDWPWFYRAWPWPRHDPQRLEVALDSEALWGRPLYRLLGGHPKFPEADSMDRLAAWRGWVRSRVSGVGPAELTSLAQLRGPLPEQDPFFASRFAGSRVLPFEMGRNGTGVEDLCRRWPAGVSLLPPSEGYAYELASSRERPGPGGAAFHLYAYRDRHELWRDYFRGRLDALLLEGADFDGELERYRASQLGSWGVLQGTQQIVLRFRPQLARQLGRGGRLALSLALPRAQLARVDGPGRFSGATAFLAPVTAPGALEPAEALAWDTLSARRMWLESKHELPELRLATMDHPLLEKLAGRIQAQWNKTLNLTLRLQVLTVDQFYRLLDAGEADVSLEVVDLDDGSLQDLWMESLSALDAPLGGKHAAWEEALRKGLPYVPVLGNTQAVLLRPDAPAGLLERVCPGCVPSGSPRRLQSEPQPPEDNPEG